MTSTVIQSPVERALILACTVFAAAVYAGTQTIVSVSLSQMQGDLSASLDEIAWVVTANVVASAVGIPPSSWLAARFGRRRIFLASIVGFTAASAMVGLATSLESVIIWRIAQGLFGAPLIPLSQAIVLDVYPKSQHGIATAVWSVGVVVGPVLAPVAGGYLTDLHSWRLAFWALIPLGLVALVWCAYYVRDLTDDDVPRFDAFGFVMVSIGLASAQLIVDRGQRLDWWQSPEILVWTGVAVVSLYVFIVHNLTARQPFLDLRIFLDRNFSAGIVIMFIYSQMILAPLVLIPTMLETLRGLEALTIGLLLLPRGCGQVVGLLAAGKLLRHCDPRLLLIGGFALHAVSTALMAGYNLDVGVADIVWPNMLQGFAMGFIFVPTMTLTFTTLAPRLRTEGAVIFSLTRNFGSSIGVSLAVVLLTRSIQISHAELATHVVPSNELLRFPEYSAVWNLAELRGLVTIDNEIVRQATMIGYVNIYWLMTIFAVAVIPLVMFIRKPQTSSVET